jgi:hypothetical protein
MKRLPPGILVKTFETHAKESDIARIFSRLRCRKLQRCFTTAGCFRAVHITSPTMMYTPNEAETKFEAYRDALRQEASRLADYVHLYRKLQERQADRSDEMNVAPAFFQLTIGALFSAIVLWVDKLCDEKSERGFFNFLTFIEYHREMLSISKLQRRRGYPDGHWVLDREPITIETINEDRLRLRGLPCLEPFKLRRDKVYAHFDKDYFFDRERISKDAPITWDEIDKALETMSELINRYSSAYDGRLFYLKALNIGDVDYLLDLIRKAKKHNL